MMGNGCLTPLYGWLLLKPAAPTCNAKGETLLFSILMTVGCNRANPEHHSFGSHRCSSRSQVCQCAPSHPQQPIGCLTCPMVHSGHSPQSRIENEILPGPMCQQGFKNFDSDIHVLKLPTLHNNIFSEKLQCQSS